MTSLRLRRGTILPLMLVIAFLAHDGWMVVAHAGHIVYATPSSGDPSALGGNAHAGHHDPAPTRVILPGNVELVPLEPSPPPMTVSCVTLRAGTLGQPTSVPGPAVSLAVLPLLNDGPNPIDVCGRIDWRPPGQPPDVRRALLQVYRE